MGIFDNLWSKITGHAHTTAAASSPASPSAATPAASTPMAGVTATSSSAPAATAAPVDVEAILDDLDSKQSHRSNWRESIVDMMSLLGMDNSLSARRELAKELGYTGDTNDTATMNVWLHKQVMQKMAANGGKVPQNLLQ